MGQTLIIINDPICEVIKDVTDATFDLLTANYPTGVVTSAQLSPLAVKTLTEHLQRVISAAPVIADIEAGFAGLVRSLLTTIMFEAGAFTNTVTYAAPTATMTLAGLVSPSHIGVSVPMSTSSPVIGQP